MTLIEVLKAALAHRDVDAANFQKQIDFAEKNHDLQIAFLNTQKNDALEEHDKRIAALEAVIKAHVEAHQAFIGAEAARPRPIGLRQSNSMQSNI